MPICILKKLYSVYFVQKSNTMLIFNHQFLFWYILCIENRKRHGRAQTESADLCNESEKFCIFKYGKLMKHGQFKHITLC